jgi:hypothetical protein
MALDLKKIKDNYDKQQKSGGGSDKYKTQKGENPVRVVPHSMKYFGDAPVEDIAFAFYMHFNVGPEGAKSAVVCPKTLNRKNRCPICEASAAFRKSDDQKEKALGDDLSYRRRYLLNVIDLRSAETIAKGIQPYECGPKVYEGIIQWCNEKWGDPLDFKEGRNLTIIAHIPPSGDVQRTEYKVEPDPNKSSAADYLPPTWKDQIAKLETLVPKVLTYEEIKKVLEGEVDYGHQAAPAEPVDGEETAAPSTAGKEDAKVIKDEKKKEEKKPADNGGKKDCYGKLFSGRSEKCQACGEKEACKTEFLKP